MTRSYMLAAADIDLKLADRQHFTLISMPVQKNMEFSFHATVIAFQM
jgi:hypothetical protein